MVVLAGLLAVQKISAQTSYFADGYHGGIYGHYPLWVTKFIADNTDREKDWRLNLEIEPDTWDTVALKDPENYERIKKIINTPSQNGIAEYVNPTYAQSYLFNSSIESTIRQFQYGMEKLRLHFPLITFTTYSSEEPCFTSALPQILKSLGIKYAVLKNPNTCWGGYVKAYGGQSLYWTGPDGSSILTVPRYGSEALVENSAWQTTAWNHSLEFINAARKQGITHPVGMCLQDAGWRNGPWLNHHKSPSTHYTTWRNYFNRIAQQPTTEYWRLSQEDIRVSLVWGAQVVQRIAQQVRAAENKVTAAEKQAALATLYNQVPYPQKELDNAWKNILLAQHHDCWIVPYNRMNGITWADHVKEWTGHAGAVAQEILQQSVTKKASGNTLPDFNSLTIYNPTSFNRDEVVSYSLPDPPKDAFIIESDGKKIPHQLVKNDSVCTLLFRAAVPALGSRVYSLAAAKKETVPSKGAFIRLTPDGDYCMETDLYRLIVDAKKGNIKQLTAKQLNDKNFITESETRFNTLRGFFFNENKFVSSLEEKPVVTLLENGPVQIRLRIEGTINNNRFTQIVQLQQGEKKIDLRLYIDYTKRTGIGDDYGQYGGYKAEGKQKAFYNDTSKLLVRFPLNLEHQKLYKDAPLDVTESRLSGTFYNRWDEIKNNIIFNWVDITDTISNYGMALLSDHVTSYSHGPGFPLSLTVQYAGIGLWGRNYTVNGPTEIRYALLPHRGNWQHAQLNRETAVWNAPLIVHSGHKTGAAPPFVKQLDPGLEITALYYKGTDLYVRITNTGSRKRDHQVRLNCHADQLHFVELNNEITDSVKPDPAAPVSFNCTIPLFGFKTIRLTGARP
ncbi:glycoside hydrolase family 38 C-terminal domain-containing protein [Niabella beijingensis]|uniref:glycoside hydrolase family 38 C-terminal domain-containing protein n=1 Tax=Niabella beijingensis TaxID=2872700 RepID=UPI001CBCB47C|nr:glycoside hydrolase family 38 C-terminal domain-containing protein [Niabella beijingensis]MBZ4191348.1 glycosyl hydrolase [Niabella beijingensis]